MTTLIYSPLVDVLMTTAISLPLAGALPSLPPAFLRSVSQHNEIRS